MNKGYVAISSVLIIAAVVLIIGTTISLVSISEGQMSLSGIQSDTALGILEGCTDETLLYINENNSLPTSVTTPDGICTVTLDSLVGNIWTITLSTTVNSFTKTVKVTLNRSSTITITSWEEI
jgi:hypothetical protein